jgi:proton-dependent oligopeptide transporter, POT family
MYRTQPLETERMPPGIPHIIGNEAAERFSFYGMKAILAAFLTQYLYLMDGRGGQAMDETRSTELVHLFIFVFYLTPILGAILADVFFGKYRVIMFLSLVYCAGHAALAMMGQHGNSETWLYAGLVMIALGAGGIKPCVSAHVGDQFGEKNARFLPRIFNWFYFSINFGAFFSMLLTPWLLEWYGPHWAFGVPGVLMAVATFIFWLGRNRFTHVPAGGFGFLREAFGRDGMVAMLKLAPVYLFVAVFWALFDQTSSTWIFQAGKMDRNFLGFEWLPSQIQSLNSVFVLSFIPLFSYMIYPVVEKFWPLNPLRKMGMGFVLMTASFVLVSLIQMWIDEGQRPNIGWQVGAFALLTAAEILISIVALEFAYTQAPRKMKSFIMCFYLAAVAVGNLLVVGVNHWMRVPSAAEERLAEAIEQLPKDWRNDPRTAVVGGYDSRDAKDVFVWELEKGEKKLSEVPGQENLDRAAEIIIAAASLHGDVFPLTESGNEMIKGLKDHWGRPLRYLTISSTSARIWSAGGDGKWSTKWDVGILIEKEEPKSEKGASWLDRLRPEKPWLEEHKKKLGISDDGAGKGDEVFSKKAFSGGQVKLEGATYFWFFSGLMAATAVLFVPFAMLYKPKSYLQDESQDC